jgi:polyisoprenoid-binding protein YceI
VFQTHLLTSDVPIRNRILAFVSLSLIVSLSAAAVQWSMQPKESQLTFVGAQAGAPLEGKFEKFTADIRFDPEDLAGSRFEVKIDTASVNTRDGERDSTLKGADLFSVKQFPSAQYVAEKFTDKGKGQYAASGKLTLRNVTKDVPIEFTFEQHSTGAWLKGSASIKRLDFGVGQGDWKDTETVANEVKVKFALLLKSS